MLGIQRGESAKQTQWARGATLTPMLQKAFSNRSSATQLFHSMLMLRRTSATQSSTAQG
jgi:hypothetical protein